MISVRVAHATLDPIALRVLRHTSLLPVSDVAAHRLDAVLRAPPAALPEILREKVLAEAKEDAVVVRQPQSAGLTRRLACVQCGNICL